MQDLGFSGSSGWSADLIEITDHSRPQIMKYEVWTVWHSLPAGFKLFSVLNEMAFLGGSI
jgi:hypothetical protein